MTRTEALARWSVKPSHPSLRPVVEFGDSLVYALQPKQMECLEQTPLMWKGYKDGVMPPTRIGYGGAAGGGKSHLSRAVAVLMAYRKPGSVTIIFRRTHEEIRDNHIIPFITETHALKEGREYVFNKSEKTVYWKNGSLTRFGYLERDDHVFKYQGNQYDCMIFEESTHYSWFQVSWLMGNRLRANVDGLTPFAMFPSNPGNIGHAWYTRLFIDKDYRGEEKASDHAFVQAKLQDNRVLMQRDPEYIKKLNTLPEPFRSQLRDGDFRAGTLTPLSCLRSNKHLIAPFDPPAHWVQFGAFDWGYQHPWSFGWYTVDEDGTIYKLKTITGRHMPIHKIHEHIVAAGVPLEKLQYVAAGRDLWHVQKARGENTPTLAEQFADLGLYQMVPANVDRVAGLHNLGEYLLWDTTGPNGLEGEPALYFVEEPGNIACMDQMKALVPDPKNPEDVLKQDADEFGEGGDDSYDETRYAVASRPKRAIGTWKDQEISAFSPEVLAHEATQQKRSTAPSARTGKVRIYHPEFGENF